MTMGGFSSNSKRTPAVAAAVVATSKQQQRTRDYFIKSVSLGSGTLHESKENVHHVVLLSKAPPKTSSSSSSSPPRRLSTRSTTLLEEEDGSVSASSSASSPSPSSSSSSSSPCSKKYQQYTDYEYSPTTGLPIFHIDQCTDEELLGGEVSPLLLLQQHNNSSSSSSSSSSKEKELAAIYEMRSQLTNDEKKELTDPTMLLRHYWAEKGNISHAMTTLREALQWRRQFEANALRVCMMSMSKSDNSDDDDDDDNNKAETTTTTTKGSSSKDYQAMMRLENETGKIFVRGTTLEGRALMYMFAMRNNTHSDLDNMRHLVWNLEKAIRVTKHHSNGRLDKYCLLIDCANYSLKKAPSLQASKMTLDVLQKHFKERMHRIYVLNPPLAFRIFWNMVKPFIDPVTKTKIVFCTPNNPKDEGLEQLREDVGPEQAKRMEPCAFGTEPIREFNSKEYLELPMHIGFDE